MALRQIAARTGFSRRTVFIGNVILAWLPYQLVGKIIGSLRIRMNLNENERRSVQAAGDHSLHLLV